MHGLMSGRLLKRLLGRQEVTPVDAPAAEAETLQVRPEQRSSKPERQPAEQAQDMQEPSADEVEAKE